jgi:HK97 gp10 family phage protein
VIVIRSNRGETTRIFSQIEGVGWRTRRAIRQTWFRLGIHLRGSTSREILRRPKSGRVYLVRLGRRVFRHRASAPGETHANLTGRARRSLGWRVHGEDSLEFGYGVSTTARNAAPVYAEFLEFGTSRMAPRPSLQNTIRVADGDFEDFARRAMAGEFA